MQFKEMHNQLVFHPFFILYTCLQFLLYTMVHADHLHLCTTSIWKYWSCTLPHIHTCIFRKIIAFTFTVSPTETTRTATCAGYYIQGPSIPAHLTTS